VEACGKSKHLSLKAYKVGSLHKGFPYPLHYRGNDAESLAEAMNYNTISFWQVQGPVILYKFNTGIEITINNYRSPVINN
jgi:hypothetical protein